MGGCAVPPGDVPDTYADIGKLQLQVDEDWGSHHIHYAGSGCASFHRLMRGVLWWLGYRLIEMDLVAMPSAR